jgi:hypothetical protein
MNDFISTIQDAISEALASLDVGQPDGYLRRRAAFNGASVKAILHELELLTPAVVVSFTDADIAGGPFRKRDDVTMRFALWCADANLRGQEAAAQGSGLSGEGPGAFQIAEDVVKTLRHRRIVYEGRDSLGIVFDGAEWIDAANGLAVVRVDCTIVLPQLAWPTA